MLTRGFAASGNSTGGRNGGRNRGGIRAAGGKQRRNRLCPRQYKPPESWRTEGRPRETVIPIAEPPQRRLRTAARACFISWARRARRRKRKNRGKPDAAFHVLRPVQMGEHALPIAKAQAPMNAAKMAAAGIRATASNMKQAPRKRLESQILVKEAGRNEAVAIQRHQRKEECEAGKRPPSLR